MTAGRSSPRTDRTSWYSPIVQTGIASSGYARRSIGGIAKRTRRAEPLPIFDERRGALLGVGEMRVDALTETRAPPVEAVAPLARQRDHEVGDERVHATHHL